MSKTQLESAKAGIITEEMKAAAIGEPLTAEQIRDFVAKGWVVIPKNKNRSFPQVKAIGKGLRTKVNANLGTSDEKADLEFEKKKAAKGRQRRCSFCLAIPSASITWFRF